MSIPAALEIAEIQALNEDCVAFNNLLVNQVVRNSQAETYLSRFESQQDSCMERLDKTCKEWSITMIKVALSDADVQGIYGLRALPTLLFS